MSQTLRMAVAGAAWLAATVPLLGHHALSAEYDSNVVLTLSGPVTTVEWTNPHTFVSIAVPTPDGKTEAWRVEGGSPGTLIERKISREMFSIGTVVRIVGYQAKDHSMKAWGRDITFADGRTFYMGSGKTPPRIGGPPLVAPRWSPVPYVLAVPGVVLAVGLFILWRRADQRGRDAAR